MDDVFELLTPELTVVLKNSHKTKLHQKNQTKTSRTIPPLPVVMDIEGRAQG